VEQSKWYRRRWIALIFLNISLLVIALDNTVLNLALPSIARDLGSRASDLQWIVDVYILVFAGLLLTSGSIGDHIGRKRTLQVGLIIFALFSVGAALSTSTAMLIGMRAMKGIGGALIMPSTLSTLTATFRDNKERAQAIAIWSATFGLGLGIGPLVGGWLLDHYSWSSVFYINLPVMAVGLIGGYVFIHDSKAEHARKLDVPGALLSIAGLFALVYGIIQAGMDGWTAPQVLAAFGAAALLLTAFGIVENKVKQPMLRLAFFKNLSFTGANIALTLVFFGMMGSFFFLGQYLQSVLGYSPLEAGIRLLPNALVSAVTAANSSRIARRIGTKYTVALGILLTGAGFLYFAIIADVNTAYSSIVIGMCVTAMGMGLTMSPATNSVMGSIPVAEAGGGSAMNDTTRQIGGALGVAVLGTLMNAGYLSQVNAIQWPPQTPPQLISVVSSSIQGAHVAAQSIPNPQLSQLIISKANEAFVYGMRQGLIVTAIILGTAAIATLIILPNNVRHYHEEIPPLTSND
jgi:EmrB/QacA subfamily drug resistance transporter